MAHKFFNACQLGLLEEVIAMLEDKNFNSKSFLDCNLKNLKKKYHVDLMPVNIRDCYGRTGLHFASSLGHFEMVKFLVSKGANVNAKTNEGFSALMMACIDGHFTICKYLLWQNCDIYFQVRSLTALDYAKIKGHEEIVGLFATII